MKSLTKSRKLYALFLAILPLMSIYRLPGTKLAIATVLTTIMVIYAIYRLLTKKMQVSFSILAPFVLYIMYIMTKSTWQYSFLCGLALIHIFAICTGVVNVRQLRKYIEVLSVAAAVCAIFQQLTYIFTGIHVPMYIISLLTEGMKDQYSIAISTSFFGGMYRPSAFFLEPSHMTQFCMIGLGSCLFKQNRSIKKALLISIGVVASTSGMGIVSVVAMWTWWGLVVHNKGNNRKIVWRIPVISLLLLISIYALDNISFTHSIISRFTANSSGEYNAIVGRTFWWDTYFGSVDINYYLTGLGLESLPEGQYFTGFMKQLYCYGLIGVSLLFIFLIRLIFISDNLGKACCALYIGLLFFAELTNYYWLIFYIGVFLTFYLEKKKIDNFDIVNYSKMAIKSQGFKVGLKMT